jgi:glycosyltransferase 2 family protein
VRSATGGAIGQIVLGLLLLALTFAVLALRVDIAEGVALLDDIDPPGALAGVALFGFSKLVHTLRWRMFLAATERAPIWPLYGVFLLSNLVNAILPLRLGDAARVQLTAARFAIPRSELTASVFVVETLLNTLSYVVLLALLVLFSDVPGLSRALFAVLAVATLAFVAAAALLSRRGEAAEEWLSTSTMPAASAVAPAVGGFMRGLILFSSPAKFLITGGLSLLGWLIEAGAYAAFGEAFEVHLEPYEYVIVMIAANFLTSIPLTPLGLGIYELGLQELVAAFGVDPELAFAYAFGSHLLLLSWVAVAGVVSAVALRVRPSELFYLRRPGEGESGMPAR